MRHRQNRPLLMGQLALCLALAGPLGRCAAQGARCAESDTTRPWQQAFVLVSEELLRPGVAEVLADLPLVFLHDRGARGQWLSFSALGSTPRETGLFVDGLDLRDPISGVVDLNVLPAFWMSAVRLDAIGATWGPPRSSAGATLVGTALRHTGNRPLSHVGYENGDWGVRGVDVGLGMRLSRNAAAQVGALVAGFDGYALRQQHAAQRVRGSAAMHVGHGWKATYAGLLTKAETEETPDPVELALHAAVLPVWKDRRVDQALSFQKAFGTSAVVQSTVAHTELKREFHDYPLGQRWIDNSRVVSLASSACLGGERAATLLGAMVRYANRQRETGDSQSDLEASLRLGVRMQLQSRWRIQLLCDALTRQDAKLYLAPSLQVVRVLGGQSWLTVDGSREVFLPSFQERYGVGRTLGNVGVSPWVVHRAALGVTIRKERCLLFAGGFFRDSGHEIFRQWQPSEASFVHVQAAERHRQIGLAASISTNPIAGLDFRGGLVAQTPLGDDEHLPEVPAWHGMAAVAYSLELFQSDLQLAVRAFCQLLGERYDVRMEHRLSSVAVPGFEVEARIMHNASVWLRFPNLLGLDYQAVGGYPMPTRFLTWGINWSFVD